MCGICGAVGYKEEVSKKEEILKHMMEAIRHRGPDGGNRYIVEDVMLGFQRLCIIDKNTGMQPMWNEDRSVVLVFNGEIYNYKALRRELTKKGHIFSSESDSEVLVHGYEEYQMGLLGKLRGMFSFAIWDKKRKTLFAARDFFGIKPFYYTLVEGTLVFASEIKSILKFPGYHPAVNEEALEQYVSFQYSVLPETLFKGIYQLRPGHYLEFKSQESNLRVDSYYEATLEPMKYRRWRDIYTDIREAITNSIKRHLVSDVEVGSFLSGGVDSSLIAALSGCKKTFTVGFADEGERYNETQYARELAEWLGIKNRCHNIGKEEFMEAVPKVLYHLDEPLGDASAVALYFLAREASKEVKVVLSGEGADEIFGGYNIYLEPKARSLLCWIPFPIRKQMARLAEQYLPEHMKGRNYLIRSGKKLKEQYIGNAYIFHEKEKNELFCKDRSGSGTQEFLEGDYLSISHLKDSDQMQSIDLKYWLPGDILQKADRMSMAHSLELRVPFLDRDVFRVARRIPHRLKTRHYTTKYVLRRVAEVYLPLKVAYRKKLGFPIPIRSWIREEDWYQQIRELFMGKAAARYFHQSYLLKLLEEHKVGKVDNSRKIWTIYTFLVWYQMFFEQMEEITEVDESGSREDGERREIDEYRRNSAACY